MLSQYFALNLEQQLSKITDHGFCLMDNFITSTTALALSNEINVLHDGANMHKAGMGQTLISINKHLCGDSIYWLDEAVRALRSRFTLGRRKLYAQAIKSILIGLNQPITAKK